MNRGQLKFTFLTGDTDWKDYGGVFVSKRLNNGEFDYWLVLTVDILDAQDYGKDYCVSLRSISPSQAKGKTLDAAKMCCGFEPETVFSDLMNVEALNSYGIYATLFSEMGSNLNKLLKQAREKAALSQIAYGFMMDASQNQIGTSGWDRQKGDLLAGLNRLNQQQ